MIQQKSKQNKKNQKYQKDEEHTISKSVTNSYPEEMGKFWQKQSSCVGKGLGCLLYLDASSCP